MMNRLYGMVNQRKALSRSSRDRCQRSLPSQIFYTSREGFERAQNLSEIVQ